MDIKRFLELDYSYDRFKEFIFDRFYGFEENATEYIETQTLSEQQNIQKYKFMGSCQLDDKKEIGFFEVITTKNTDIENNRVSLGNFLKTKTSNEFLDGAIAVFVNPKNPSVWRLSFIKFSYDENNKEQVSNLKRYTYVLGKNIPIKTAYNQLKDLKYPTIKDIEEAFSVDKVTKEFFEKYKELYYSLVKDITVVNQSNITQEEEQILDDNKKVSFYIKKLLGRVVFLYFVQKKSWLNSDKKFLTNLFKEYTLSYLEKNFYDEVLEDLFFKALNTKRENNKIKLGDKEYTIPYLNGGLFEEDEYDKTNLTIPNENLKEILELFDSYNFTVIEDTPHDSEVAIDPEMLGRVFEDLLEDRKEKGAFYTPREIVHYMCQQSIINYLLNFYDKENLEDIKSLVIDEKTDTKFIKINAKDIKKYLENMKVLDPAIGSGAFPMGMLHEIVSILSNLDKTANISLLKREVIENSIYGLDIEHSAVEIAKLRFWLSIVVDEDEPTPLPNLSYKIMVGNSLLETINGFDPLEISKNNKGNGERIKRMKGKFHSYFNSSSNEEKNSIKKDIEKDVDDIFGVALKNYQNELEEIISKNDLLNTNAKLQKEHQEQIQNVSLIKKIQKEYQSNRYTTELFLYKIYFAEVLENGGFDVVIGNPPYVRQEKIKELKSKQEIQNFKSYNGTADLYIYFFEKGFKLLKENGILSFITSNKYTRARYGKEFREFVLDSCSIKEYIDFNGVKVFETATVDTSILSFQKNISQNNYFLYCDIDKTYKKETPLYSFISEYTWEYKQNDLKYEAFNFINKYELIIKNRIENSGYPLKKFNIEIYRGIQTGNNNVFIIDDKIKQDLIKKDFKSKDLIYPITLGKEIRKFNINDCKNYLLYITDETNIEYYEAIYDYLLNNKSKLDEKIEVKQNKMKWYSLYRPAKKHLDKFKEEKLVWNFVTENLTFSYINSELFLLNSSFMMIGKDLKYLCAILNSKISNFYIRFVSSPPNIGAKAYLEELIIVDTSMEIKIIFDKLVDYIIYLKKEKKENYIIEFFERVIDVAVYELYFKEELIKNDFGVLDILEKELISFDNTFETIEKIYKKLSDKNHKVAYNVNFINTLDIIKTIENRN